MATISIKDMAKIAIDVALLPPEDIMDLCITLNSKSHQQASLLNRKDNLPHITLAMGIANEPDLKRINRKIENVTKNFSQLNIEITGLSYCIKESGKKSYSFRIKPTKKLVDLHGQIMKELLPILSYKVNLNMFYKEPNKIIDKISKFWVETYGEKHTDPKNYRPHISLKCPEAKYDNFPIKFTASKLALCHLGDHCTCRKILKSFELK